MSRPESTIDTALTTPDNALHPTSIDIQPLVLQHARHVRLDVNIPFLLHPHLVRGQLVPVLSDPQVEENGFARGMLDEEAEAWSGQFVLAGVFRLQEAVDGD